MVIIEIVSLPCQPVGKGRPSVVNTVRKQSDLLALKTRDLILSSWITMQNTVIIIFPLSLDTAESIIKEAKNLLGSNNNNNALVCVTRKIT